MAVEPTNSGDSGSMTLIAMIVGGLVVAVGVLFATGAFENRADNGKATITIDAPSALPPAAPSGD